MAQRRIAILGLAFKAGTDDTRESAALALAQQFLSLHAEVVTYDPLAHITVKNGSAKARTARSALTAVRGADATVIATDWPELANLHLRSVRKVMRGNVLVDGRGVITPAHARALGFDFFGFGRGGAIKDQDLS